MILPEDSRDKKTRGKVGKRKTKTGIWKSREIEYAPNEILIKLRPGKDRDNTVLKKLFSGDLEKAKMKKKFDNNGIGKILVGENVDVLKKCVELQEDPDVEYAEPNVTVTGAVIPNDGFYGNQYALPLIEAPNAWDIETGANDVVIAILDSGIPMTGTPPTLSHPDLNDSSRFIIGRDYIEDDDYPNDEFGHGTHVAGIASAQTNNTTGIAGLSWGTKIYIIRVLDEFNRGNALDIYDGIKEAVDYAVSNNLRLVINLSLGGSSPSYTMEQGVIYARDRDCLIVVAAGNHQAWESDAVSYPAAYSASYDNVIAVSNTDSSDYIASSSNFGPEVNVAAPGTSVYSTMPNYHVTLNDAAYGGHSQNYDYLTGTSMACPHVAALAALVFSCDNTISAADVRDLIESRADDLGSPNWDQYYGYGRIDAYETLKDYASTACFFAEIMVPIECVVCTFATMVRRDCSFSNVVTTWCRDKCEFMIQQDIPHIDRCKYHPEIIPCQKYEVELQCLREFSTPWERYGDPIDQQFNVAQRKVMSSASRMKHVRPLTRKTVRGRSTAKKQPLSHKKRHYPK